MNKFGSLPIELVGHVLDNITIKQDLYQCARINKSFYMEAIHRLWRDPIEIQQDSDTMYSPLAPSLLQSIHLARCNPLHALMPLGHHVRKLEFGKYKNVSHIEETLEYCPLVEELILVCLQITDEDTERIFSLCPCLKRITLRLLECITDNSITTLVRRCPKLEEIELRTNIQLTYLSLISLKECPLTRLTIIDDIHIAHAVLGLDKLRLVTIETLRQLIPTDGSAPFPFLTELNLSPLIYPSQLLVDALVLFINTHSGVYKLGTTHCFLDNLFIPTITTIPNLRQLSLSEVPEDYPFTNVYPQLQGLRIELLSGNRNVLYSIADTMPNLKSLVIKSKNRLSALSLHQIITKCTGLVFLDLSSCGCPLPGIPGVVWGTTRTLGKGQLDLSRRTPMTWENLRKVAY